METENKAPFSRQYAFAFRAKTREGREVTDRIVAISVEEAWLRLEQNGYRDIAMLDTELSAVKLDNETSRLRLRMSASEEQQARRDRSIVGTTLRLFFRSGNLIVWVPLTVWLAVRVASRGWHGDAVFLPASLLGAFLIWFVWARVPGVMYNLALDASAWNDWPAVERWMRLIGHWKRWFNTPFKEHELHTRMAMAEAGQGRVAEALQRVARIARMPDVTPAFYQGRLASVYNVARDFNNMAAAHRKSHELKPSETSAIDLATSLVLRLGQNDEAQQLLDQVDVKKLSPLARSFYERCRGVIAVNRREYGSACDHLEQALELIAQYVGSPLMKGVTADTRAYYGIALAHSGRSEEARPQFAAARAMLEARKETELLAMCDAAMTRL